MARMRHGTRILCDVKLSQYKEKYLWSCYCFTCFSNNEPILIFPARNVRSFCCLPNLLSTSLFFYFWKNNKTCSIKSLSLKKKSPGGCHTQQMSSKHFFVPFSYLSLVHLATVITNLESSRNSSNSLKSITSNLTRSNCKRFSVFSIPKPIIFLSLLAKVTAASCS